MAARLSAPTPTMVQMERLSTEDLWNGHDDRAEGGESATAEMEIGLHSGDVPRTKWRDTGCVNTKH